MKKSKIILLVFFICAGKSLFAQTPTPTPSPAPSPVHCNGGIASAADVVGHAKSDSGDTPIADLTREELYLRLKQDCIDEATKVSSSKTSAYNKIDSLFYCNTIECTAGGGTGCTPSKRADFTALVSVTSIDDACKEVAGGIVCSLACGAKAKVTLTCGPCVYFSCLLPDQKNDIPTPTGAIETEGIQ